MMFFNFLNNGILLNLLDTSNALFPSQREENNFVKARNETKISLTETSRFTRITGKSPRIIVVVLCLCRKKLFLPEPLFNYKTQRLIL